MFFVIYPIIYVKNLLSRLLLNRPTIQAVIQFDTRNNPNTNTKTLGTTNTLRNGKEKLYRQSYDLHTEKPDNHFRG